MSLGRAWVHSFASKLDAAVAHSIRGIEIFYEDLVYHAQELFPTASDAHAAQIAAAHDIRHQCASRGLQIINLQPFSQYDGLVDRAQHEQRIEEMHHWFALATALDTDLIQVPASFLPESECTGDRSVLVADLREIADLGAAQKPYPFRFAYESLAWSTHVLTWEQSWEIVQAVDRDNFGLCLDTFNILGRIYADPASETQVTSDADAAVEASIQHVKTAFADPEHLKKIFFIQVVDAEKLSAPLVQGHAFYDKDQPPRMSWSRNCRLFYGEQDQGAYMPVRELTDAIVNGIGYKGWISFELFNRCMADADPSTPESLATRTEKSWEKMVRDLNLNITEKEEQKADSPLYQSITLDKTGIKGQLLVERLEEIHEQQPQVVSIL